MLIHSYVTDGYYAFAESLIESFKIHHGDHIPFLLHTKDLSTRQIEEIQLRYKNLTIKNSTTDWEWLCRMSGMKKEQLLTGKRQVEQFGNRYMSREFYHWKHYISIYSRYRDSLIEALDFAGEGQLVLHLDADLYINRSIQTIFNLIKLADVSLLLRPGATPEWRKTYGCIMGYRNNKKSRKFLKKVRTHIHAVDFKKIPKGYGQTVFWRAYCDFRKTKEVKFAQIPQNWINKGFDNKGFILSANNGLKKCVTAKRYKVKYEKGKKNA